MPGRASILVVLIVSTLPSLLAQALPDRSHIELGEAAMAAHDPTAAITHFERDDSKKARAWLAVALMMESRSPSDRYVERAFDAAARARADDVDSLRPRAELAAALRPGDIVVTFLVAERHAYAWAFDRDTLIGYPLPPPDEIVTSVERLASYAANKDRAGVQRIAEDFLPALLGPVVERIPTLTRAIFVIDGPLRRLSIGALPVGDGAVTLSQQLAVATVTDNVLLDEIRRAPARPATPARAMTTLVAAAIVIAIVTGGVLAMKRRSSVA